MDYNRKSLVQRLESLEAGQKKLFAKLDELVEERLSTRLPKVDPLKKILDEVSRMSAEEINEQLDLVRKKQKEWWNSTTPPIRARLNYFWANCGACDFAIKMHFLSSKLVRRTEVSSGHVTKIHYEFGCPRCLSKLTTTL